jgi:hypothetical protein
MHVEVFSEIDPDRYRRDLRISLSSGTFSKRLESRVTQSYTPACSLHRRFPRGRAICVADRCQSKNEEFMQITPEHIEQLRCAKLLLENPGLTAKIANVIGKPIERGMELLPDKWSEVVNDVTKRSLEKALNVALITFGKKVPLESSDMWHKIAATASGAGGGAFGLPALVIELPVSTTIMLRSIADIARSEGEDIRLAESKLACLEVFAFGGRTSKDDAGESGYFAVRAALAKAVSEAAEFIAERGLAKEGAPVIARLISQIATRFGVNVSEKAAAQTVPAVGAVGGALINLAFIDHFQDMARGHFTVRRLERIYGTEVVRSAYRKLNDQ